MAVFELSMASPEFQYKAIQGKDSFYVVKKAWKYSPSSNEVATWSKFMSTVKLYDSRNKSN